jgi:hypothetical protein
MSIQSIPTIEEDVKTATEAIEARRPVPSDVEARLDEYAAEFRERIFRQHGYLDSASMIREDREIRH